MRIGTYFFKHIAGIAALTATTFCTLYGQSINLREVRNRLSQPVVLLLENGQQRSGEIDAWDGETLSLRIDIGGGSASMNYAADAIRDISFTGSEYLPVLYKLEKNPARSDEAFALFEAFYQLLKVGQGQVKKLLLSNDQLLNHQVLYHHFCKHAHHHTDIQHTDKDYM